MPDSLVLSDGTLFHGTRFGSQSPVVGEVVFFTGVVGWQEVLTDPAYAGKIVVFTYPHVGNYGVNNEDMESSRATVRGIVVRALARFHSNFRSTRSFGSWAEDQGITVLDGVDTRAAMVHARDHGAGLGAIAANAQQAVEAMGEAGSPFERNLVATVQGICRMPETGGRADGETGRRGDGGSTDAGTRGRGDAANTHHSSPITHHSELASVLSPQSSVLRLAVLDLGGKYSLYRQMAELGCELRYFPWDAGAELIAASGVDGLLLPSGPGDPGRLGQAASQVARLLGKLPILGVGLGLQLLALAMGARTYRLKTGRHGVNYPVQSTRGEPSLIAACHHSFAVDAASLPPGVETTYLHLNEGTVMGIEAAALRAWGYQFHPGRDGDGGPSPLLAQFVDALRTKGDR